MGIETLDKSAFGQELPPQEITGINPILFIQKVEEVVVENSDMLEEAVRYAFRYRENPDDIKPSIQLPLKLDGIPYTAEPNGYQLPTGEYNKSILFTRREDMNQRSFKIDVIYKSANGQREVEEVVTTIDGSEVSYEEFYERVGLEFPEFYERVELDIAA